MLYELKGNLPFLGPIIPDEVRAVFDKHGKTAKSCKKDFIQPHYAKNLIYVKKGIIGGYIINNNLSKAQILRLVLPMRAYGGPLLLDGLYLANHLFALTDTEYVSIGVSRFWDIISADYDLYKRCVHLFAAYETRDVERFYILLTSRAEMRLRLLMRSLAMSLPQDENDPWLRIPAGITREQYSKIIYTTTNTLDSILTRWKADRLYKRSGKDSFINRKLTEKIYREGRDFTEIFYEER